MEDIAWIDKVVYGITILSVLWGAMRGFFSSMFGILTLVLAFFIARDFSPALSPFLFSIFGEKSPLAPLAAACLVFLISFTLLGLLSQLIVVILKKADMGGLNILGGAFFGFLRAVVFSIIFILALSAFGVQKREVWRESTTVPMLGVVLQEAMAIPFLADYRHWLHFDKHQRPVLVDGRAVLAERKERAAGKKNKKKLKNTSETTPDLHQSLEKTQSRNDELGEVMDELANYTAIKRGNSPSKDDIHRAEPQDVGELIENLLCMLTKKQDCYQ